MRRSLLCLILLCSVHSAYASIFSQVRGVVHDPQHRPIAGATITLRAGHSTLAFTAVSDANGAFEITAVPLGDYIATVSDAGFADLQQTVTIGAGSALTLHFQLTIATANQSVAVHAAALSANVDSVTPATVLDRIDITKTPGADRSNSLAIITDFVPGAYMTHDMLHMRGGHELSWLIDGVAIPNTNIASNVGPQIDPKDIDTLEVDRGSYSASLGDRTYGMFNVVPRTGFERNRGGELVLSAGNFFQTNDQISLGDHTEKLAWYASLNGNRSDYGLQPAIEQPVHDAENGYGGFASIVYNHDPANQLRLVTQLRSDYYQIPKDPDPNDWQSIVLGYPTNQLNDGEHETDSYAALSWLHTFNPSTVSQIAPFYHFNRANYQSDPYDFPVATTADETGNYAGLQASISTVIAKNTISAGIYGYMQHENDLFGLIFNDSSGNSPISTDPIITAGVQEAFVEDNYKPSQWLTLIAGERQTHFSGAITEDAIYPRLGIAVMIPKLDWVFRAFYGHFYQPPPVTTLSGALLDYAQQNGLSFLPLKGERNEEHQFGVQIPFHGWLLDADTFQTQAQNFLDHQNIGESSVYIPVTVQGALIQAWELTLRTPHLWRYGQAHLSYSNQIAQQIGPVKGGAICDPATDPNGCAVAPGYSPLDHDQRNTLNIGYNGSLPHRVTASFNVYYGSGFSNGYIYPPSPYAGPYLPSHTTADLVLGKDFGKQYTLSFNVLNVGNTRVLLDNSLTFGGFHYNDPRQIYGELRYRFHY